MFSCTRLQFGNQDHLSLASPPYRLHLCFHFHTETFGGEAFPACLERCAKHIVPTALCKHWLQTILLVLIRLAKHSGNISPKDQLSPLKLKSSQGTPMVGSSPFLLKGHFTTSSKHLFLESTHSSHYLLPLPVARSPSSSCLPAPTMATLQPSRHQPLGCTRSRNSESVHVLGRCVLMVWGQWSLVTLCWHLGTFPFFMALSVICSTSFEVFAISLISYVWPSFATL